MLARGLAGGFLTVLLSTVSAAPVPVDDLARCAAIAEDGERLACYDALAEKQKPAGEANTEGTARQAAAPTVEEEGAVEKRIEQEEKAARNWFALTPYRPNYVLPLTYNFNPNNETFQELRPGEDIDNVEVKFQVSLQFDLWPQMFVQNLDLYAAYTQLAFWQAYNTEASSPFRETNYEPELGLRYRPDLDLLGINLQQINLGVVHQSNGRGEPLSRSWNRVFAAFLLERGDFALLFKPWYRIPEDDADDDNPDITGFLGYGELYGFYKRKQQTFALMARNNLKTSHNRGAVQVDWSFPMTGRLKGYVQYFYGYGESLVDYDHLTNRIGVGLMISDWL